MLDPRRQVATSLVTVLLGACGTEPSPPFVLVEDAEHVRVSIDRSLPSDRPWERDVFLACQPPEGRSHWARERLPANGGPGDVTVVQGWDAVYHDGIAVDLSLQSLLSVDASALSTDWVAEECLDGQPPADQPLSQSLLCTMDAWGLLVSGPERERLCGDLWSACYWPLAYGTDGFIYPQDAVYLDGLFGMGAEAVEICLSGACQAYSDWIDRSNSLQRACRPPPSDDLGSLACGAKDEWEAHYGRYLDRVAGDASITVVNTAKRWRPVGGAAASTNNAGICGVWMFSDDDFAALVAPRSSEDGAELSPLISELCGGVAVPYEAPERPLPQPMTIVRASLGLTDGTGDANYYLFGEGDIAGAAVLTTVDDPKRACPGWCRGTDDVERACTMLSGAATLRFGSDFRYRAGGRPVHVVAAECNPFPDSAAAPPTRACWHAEIDPASLAAGNHLRVEIGGIGRTFERSAPVSD